jgi:hypothetical protein
MKLTRVALAALSTAATMAALVLPKPQQKPPRRNPAAQREPVRVPIDDRCPSCSGPAVWAWHVDRETQATSYEIDCLGTCETA